MTAKSNIHNFFISTPPLEKCLNASKDSQGAPQIRSQTEERFRLLFRLPPVFAAPRTTARQRGQARSAFGLSKAMTGALLLFYASALASRPHFEKFNYDALQRARARLPAPLKTLNSVLSFEF